MIAAWFNDRGLAFDLETTGPEPEDARIVTAHASEVSPTGAKQRGAWLVDPGIPIPEGAIAIHGITNEIAAVGSKPLDAVTEICALLQLAWSEGLPLIAFNANYDMTVVVCECLRLGLPVPKIGPIIDPFVIDRAVDPYRPGKRKLPDVCAHYGVKQEGAHSADGDALAAARLAWAMARRVPEIRHLTLYALQEWQRREHAARQENYRLYLIEKGKPGADKVDGSWPIRKFPRSTQEAA